MLSAYLIANYFRMNSMHKTTKALAIILFFLLTPFLLIAERITISAIGDIMAHKDMQDYLLAHEEEYHLLFNPTRRVFLSDDLTIANLETPVSDSLPVAGFPRFNARTSLVSALRAAGVELLSLANNHTLDNGTEGLLSTITAVEREGILYSGTGRTPMESQRVVYFRVKGVVIGFISITFSVNGAYYQEEQGKPAVNLVHPGNNRRLNRFCSIIEQAQKNCDLMIVAYHSGKEYIHEPIMAKTAVMERLAEAGADVILGHHPHVLQKVEYYKKKKGGRTLIAYSLGNFTSSQARYNYFYKHKGLYESLPVRTAEGIILQFDVVKWNNRVEVLSPRMLPIFNVTYTKEINNSLYRGYKSYLIDDIMNDNYEFLKKHKHIDKIKKIVEYRLDRIKKIVGLPAASN